MKRYALQTTNLGYVVLDRDTGKTSIGSTDLNHAIEVCRAMNNREKNKE